MKTLFLVRHAKSDRDGLGAMLEDIDRPLNERGYNNAHLMSNILKEKKHLPDMIITSPAIRALTTALIFARNFKYSPKNIMIEEGIYHGTTENYIKAVQKAGDSYRSVMLFGHNPTITAACNHLNTFFIDHIPTTGIACIDLKISDWQELDNDTKGELRFMDFPKNHI